MDDLYVLSDGSNDIGFFVNKNNTDPISKELKAKNAALLYQSVHLLKFYNPQGIFLDIGANLGIFSFVFGANGYKVYAFEANIDNAAQMEKAQEYNQFDVTIIPSAVTEKSGVYFFHNDGPFGHLVNTFFNHENDSLINGISIDDWSQHIDAANVNLIKIDVEGSEIEVVKGMSRFLEIASYPPIYTEFNGWCLSWSQRTMDDFFDFFSSLGYHPYIIKNQNTAEKVNCRLQPKCVVDFLMIHESNLSILNGKTILEGSSEMDSLFFKEARKSSNPCEVYYYAWTILHVEKLQQHAKISSFLDHLKRFNQPYCVAIYSSLVSKLNNN